MRYLIPLILFGILLFFLYLDLAKDQQSIPSPLINKPVSVFVAANLMTETTDLTQKIFLGHWSLLVVWASWCASCVDEQDFLLKLGQSSLLHLYGLNYRDSLVNAKDWLMQQGNPYEYVIYDPQGLLAIDLGVYGVPESFLIDPKGIIRYKQVGPLNQAVWMTEMLPLILSREDHAYSR